jgi:ECF sigma factor
MSLDEPEGRVPTGREVDVAALDEGLRELEAVNEELAQVVEMQFFEGMSEEQIARCWGSPCGRWIAAGRPPGRRSAPGSMARCRDAVTRHHRALGVDDGTGSRRQSD